MYNNNHQYIYIYIIQYIYIHSIYRSRNPHFQRLDPGPATSGQTEASVVADVAGDSSGTFFGDYNMLILGFQLWYL